MTRLDAGGCHVELVPGTRVFVRAEDASATPGVPLTALMTVGETVIATVVKVGEPDGKGWRLTLVDIEPDAVPFAAALLPGGPQWLTTPDVTVPEAAGEEAVPPVVALSPSPAEASTASGRAANRPFGYRRPAVRA